MTPSPTAPEEERRGPAHAAAGRRAMGRVLAAVCVARFLECTLRMSVAPFLPEFMARFDVGYAGAGLLFSAFFVGFMGCILPAGWLADRWPAHRLVGSGLVLLCLSTATFVAAPTWGLALAARVAMGVASALVAPPAFRLVAGVFPRELRARATGAIESSIGGALLFSLTVTPLLARWVKPDAVFLATGGLCLLPAAMLAWWDPLLRTLLGRPESGTPVKRAPAAISPGEATAEAEASGARARPPAGDRRAPLPPACSLVVIALLAMSGLLVSGAFQVWLPTYLRVEHGYSLNHTATLLAFMLVVYIPTAFFGGSYADRLGRRLPLVHAGSLLMMAGLIIILLGAARSVPLLVLVAVLSGMGSALNMGLLMAMATEVLGPGRAGLGAGSVQLVGQLGNIGAGVLFGWLVDLTGDFRWVWWLGLMVLLLRLLPARWRIEQPLSRSSTGLSEGLPA